MKILISWLIVLIVFAAIGIISAPYLISTETFKNKLIQRINQSSGYAVTINGEIKIGIFPTVTAYLGNVTVHNIANSSLQPFIQAKSITADIELLPLLHKEVIVKSLALESPEITLHTDTGGRINWKPGMAQADAATEQNKPAPAATPLQNFLLNNASISHGSLIYLNEKLAKDWTIKDIDLEVELKKSSVLTLAGTIKWNDRPVNLRMEIDTLEQAITGQPFKIKSALKNDLMAFDADGVWKTDAYMGKINAAFVSLRDFMLWMRPSEKFPPQLRPLIFNIGGDADCGTTYCNITNSALKLDEIRASGNISANWANPVPQLMADLITDELDLNLFLPAEKVDMSNDGLFTPALAAEKSLEWSNEPFDTAALQAADLDLKISVNKILACNVTAANTSLTVKLQRGRLVAGIADADFYGGKASISIEAEPIGKTLSLDQRISLSGIQIEPLLKDALNDDRMSGTGDIKLNMESVGKNPFDLVSGLSGGGYFKIENGAFKGFNLAEMARNVQSAFGVRKPGESRTDFTEVAGTFTINQGIITNSDLSMKAPFIRLTGSGKISLPLSTIEYRLLPQFVDTAQGQGGKDKTAMAAVPIIVEGRLDDPSFRPDVKSIVKDAIENPDKVKQQLKGAKGAIKDMLRKF